MANASDPAERPRRSTAAQAGSLQASQRPRRTPPPAAVVASILTAEELDGLREMLEAHGAATEGLDDEQLLDLTDRLQQGLPVYEGESERSPKSPQGEVVASILTAEELDGLREELETHGVVTEGLDDEQLLDLTDRLHSQGLPVYAGEPERSPKPTRERSSPRY